MVRVIGEGWMDGLAPSAAQSRYRQVHQMSQRPSCSRCQGEREVIATFLCVVL